MLLMPISLSRDERPGSVQSGPNLIHRAHFYIDGSERQCASADYIFAQLSRWVIVLARKTQFRCFAQDRQSFSFAVEAGCSRSCRMLRLNFARLGDFA